jgi:flagellar basal-body rod protein FlgC
MATTPNTTSTGSMMAVASSAMRAQQARMRVIAENIANADSTARSPGADPYRRQLPVFEPVNVDGGGAGVKLSRVMPDSTDFKLEYAPGHPAADKNGYIKLPNVDPLIESLDMRAAQRAYEANLNVIEAARTMQSHILDLLKN